MDSNPNIEDDDKIELIVNICHKLAAILKDPTESGKKDLSADLRTQAREEAHDELLTCVDVLASFAQFNHGFFDVLNIAGKYKHNVNIKQ